MLNKPSGNITSLQQALVNLANPNSQRHCFAKNPRTDRCSRKTDCLVAALFKLQCGQILDQTIQTLSLVYQPFFLALCVTKLDSPTSSSPSSLTPDLMTTSVQTPEQAYAVTFQITGRVQGVFYRATACTVAQQIGVVGYVMNVPDGSVRLCAQGTQSQLQQMRQWCHQGPPMASVTAVIDVHPMQPIPQPTYAQFSVRRD